MIRAVMTLLIAGAFASQGAAQDDAGVPPERLSRLARGVNLAHWIWLPDAKTPAERAAFIGDDELRALRAAGLAHARLPFEPAEVWDADADRLRDDGLRELMDSAARVVAAGLAVVIDAHPNRTTWAAPDPATGRYTEYEAFWTALAPALAGTDPGMVFLELMNEPHDIKDPALWPAAQARIAAIVRAACPHHTIIATGDGWGNVEGLARLTPLEDRNVVYSFHFYEPHNFTHQGATWGFPPWRHMKNLPYPSTHADLDRAAATIDDDRARQAVRRYGREPWDAARLRSIIEPAASWSTRHGRPVYCGEFGVYRPHAPARSRFAWLRDTTAALGEFGIGWSMWDYAGGFALAEGEPGHRVIDTATAGAIGLQPPAP